MFLFINNFDAPNILKHCDDRFSVKMQAIFRNIFLNIRNYCRFLLKCWVKILLRFNGQDMAIDTQLT